ncbi:unnamed protein product [Sphagnum tenellum]
MGNRNSSASPGDGTSRASQFAEARSANRGVTFAGSEENQVFVRSLSEESSKPETDLKPDSKTDAKHPDQGARIGHVRQHSDESE